MYRTLHWNRATPGAEIQRVLAQQFSTRLSRARGNGSESEMQQIS
jgi:hypothetical protein